MYKLLRRKLFSQNFLHSRELVNKLIRGSSIGKKDLILEIGPGKGIITEGLAKKAQHVIAVELDVYWYQYLQKKFQSYTNLTFYQGDILSFSLPVLPYKVFANIPFAIEGKIIRKLIDAKNPPEDCYLVVMKEVAFRLAAPYRENQFSLMHKPWFTFSIPYMFKSTDFSPVPSVKIVLFRFTKRRESLLPLEQQKEYQQFIAIGFGHGLPVMHNLKIVFGKTRTKRILEKMGINKNTKPNQLTLQRWIQLYREFYA